MSIKLMSKVWDMPGLPPGEKLVLLAIADHADDDGRAWPSINRLAVKSSISKRNLCRILKKLELKEFLSIVRERKQGSEWENNIYRINLDDRGGSDTTSLRGSDTMSLGVVTPCHGGSDTMAHESSIEPSIKNAASKKTEAATPLKKSKKNSKPLSLEEIQRKAEHTWLTAWWCWVVEQITGNRYAFSAKEAGILSRLHKQIGFSEFLNRATTYLLLDDDKRWPKGAPTLPGLSAMFNQIAGQGSTRTDEIFERRGWLRFDLDNLLSWTPWKQKEAA